MHAQTATDLAPADETRTYTVALGFAAYYSAHVTVEAASPEQACELAIANDDPSWRSIDHCGDTFVDCIGIGEGEPWQNPEQAEVPARFTEIATHAGAGRTLLSVDSRERAVILAALRLWQQCPEERDTLHNLCALVSVATDCGRFEALKGAEIDALCERLNGAG